MLLLPRALQIELNLNVQLLQMGLVSLQPQVLQYQ